MSRIAIIQARTGSSRLPGKVLEPILGESMLCWVVYRARRARFLDGVVVATSQARGDDAIAELGLARGWTVIRGSENDVLDRYRLAAEQTGAQTIVRVTADCPLIEPEVIDRVVGSFVADPRLDYASNVHPRSYPKGLDTEVFSRAALERAASEEDTEYGREHVTPYFYRNPDRFAQTGVTLDEDLSALRWTVDTPEDLAFVRAVYGHFGDGDFSWRQVLAWQRSRHELP